MKEKHIWTEIELIELKEKWNKVALYKLATYFHTTSEEIIAQAKLMNLEEYKSNRWTPEEEQLLREYSNIYLTDEIAKKLGRSYLSVQKKAIKIGIELHSEEDPWEDWMIEYLKENINKIPIGEISKKIGLSYRRILTKCKNLGIEYVPESWTDEEIEILRKYAKSCHFTELTKVLPRRSVGAITAKAFELGIETISEYTKLSEDDKKYIIDNWELLTTSEIARNLKVSVGVVNRYKKELNLPNKGQKKKWTPEVIKRLRKDAKTKTRNELAKKYKTSPGQISTLARRYNIELIDSKKIWNDELDQELIELINDNLSITEISQKMGIKASTIRARIDNLNLRKKKPKNPNIIWTDEEEKLLVELSFEKTIQELIPILNKTSRQIVGKAKKLGIELKREKEHSWTEEDTKRLIELHSEYELQEISRIMNRNESVIKAKAKELNIKLKRKKRSSWTEEEEQLLVDYAKEYSVKEIAHKLNRTTASVSSKLTYMGISAKTSDKFWTIEEEQKLRELAKDYTPDEISIIMNRTTESIVNKMYHLKIKVVEKNKKNWTKKEDELLTELLNDYTTFEVAELLDRSEESIVVRAKKIGIEIDQMNRKWTTEEEELLSDLWGDKPIEYIARVLNRTEISLVNRAFVLGLGSQIENNYDGLTIPEISNLFLVGTITILTSWVVLGLKIHTRKISNNKSYKYVTINELFEFLERNQNIWDSRVLEKNILGKEPEWLQEKRKRDKLLPLYKLELDNLNKQQLINSKKYFLRLKKEEKEKQLVKKKEEE